MRAGGAVNSCMTIGVSVYFLNIFLFLPFFPLVFEQPAAAQLARVARQGE